MHRHNGETRERLPSTVAAMVHTLRLIIRGVLLIYSRDWLHDCWKSYEYIDETPRAGTESNYFYLNVRRKTDKGAFSYISMPAIDISICRETKANFGRFQ